jgi:putative Ca2+/H+ antiporter (TMEM165/GDT1 family)
MESLLVSTGAVTLAEVGGKTHVATVARSAHYAAPVFALLGIGTLLGIAGEIGL